MITLSTIVGILVIGALMSGPARRLYHLAPDPETLTFAVMWWIAVSVVMGGGIGFMVGAMIVAP